ncbi:MAG: wax ester/triacylglycerol synthase family O-acyltransferase [Proteobacteria bacterium]|nr:wax ester/triacylglycerol synthase family O-acyltransferase [Pseudomonadota bacterium]
MSHYERLSALDAVFLEIETPSCHMHFAAVLVFEARSLTLPHGGIDFERIRRHIEAGVHYVPRYRQRIEYIPLQHHPVWVDDDDFNINYHVRHAAVPRPGTPEQLNRLVGRILAQKLDRTRPLWELYVVEGLADDRFAIVAKVHHCMVDGLAGVNVMSVWLRAEAEATHVEAPASWNPRPAPSRTELFTDELRRRRARVSQMLDRLGQIKEDPQRALDKLKDKASSVLSTVGAGIVPVSRTPLNPAQIGAYRRFDSFRVELAAAKRVARTLGTTLNDVVLATVAGAVRTYLQQQRVEPEPLDFRVLAPVSRRGAEDQGKLGNRISLLLVRLPIEQPTATARLRAVAAITQAAKRSRQAAGGEVMESLGEGTTAGMLSQAIRLGSRLRAYNLVVTNVPGPQHPLYLLGARLLDVHPVVPLYLGQALGIAIFSYDGMLFWGLHADWTALPQLGELNALLQQEFAALVAAADAHQAQGLAQAAIAAVAPPPGAGVSRAVDAAGGA